MSRLEPLSDVNGDQGVLRPTIHMEDWCIMSGVKFNPPLTFAWHVPQTVQLHLPSDYSYFAELVDRCHGACDPLLGAKRTPGLKHLTDQGVRAFAQNGGYMADTMNPGDVKPEMIFVFRNQKYMDQCMPDLSINPAYTLPRNSQVSLAIHLFRFHKSNPDIFEHLGTWALPSIQVVQSPDQAAEPQTRSRVGRDHQRIRDFMRTLEDPTRLLPI